MYLLCAVLVLTVLLYFNIRNLRLATNLTDLFGARTPEWQTVREYTQRFGYGNQLFVIIEAGQDNEDDQHQ